MITAAIIAAAAMMRLANNRFGVYGLCPIPHHAPASGGDGVVWVFSEAAPACPGCDCSRPEVCAAR